MSTPAADTVPCPVKGCAVPVGQPCIQVEGIPMPLGVYHASRHLDALVTDGHTHTDANLGSFCRVCAQLTYNRITLELQ